MKRAKKSLATQKLWIEKSIFETQFYNTSLGPQKWYIEKVIYATPPSQHVLLSTLGLQKTVKWNINFRDPNFTTRV